MPACKAVWPKESISKKGVVMCHKLVMLCAVLLSPSARADEMSLMPECFGLLFSELSVTGRVCVLKTPTDEHCGLTRMVRDKRPVDLAPGSLVELPIGGVYVFDKGRGCPEIEISVTEGLSGSRQVQADALGFFQTGTVANVAIFTGEEPREARFSLNSYGQMFDYQTETLSQGEYPLMFHRTSYGARAETVGFEAAKNEIRLIKDELGDDRLRETVQVVKGKVKTEESKRVEYSASEVRRMRASLRRAVTVTAKGGCAEVDYVALFSPRRGDLWIVKKDCKGCPLVVLHMYQEDWQCSFYDAEDKPECVLHHSRALAEDEFFQKSSRIDLEALKKECREVASRLLIIAEQEHSEFKISETPLRLRVSK